MKFQHINIDYGTEKCGGKGCFRKNNQAYRSMKDLTVIIPVYNAALLIDRCLDSIFSQRGEYQIEVICVDDGSTDDSVERIRRRQETSIRLITQQNSGPASARNKGILVAEGRCIAFLDADDYWMSDFVERTLGFLHAHRECIAVSVGQRHITMSGESVKPDAIENFDGSMVLSNFFEFWAKYNHICTGSIVIRTEVARRAGGQREDLRICEDLEYWALLATYGTMGFIPEVLFVSDGLKVTQKIGWVEKNKKRWASAPTVESWEKRIAVRGAALSPHYVKARGKIARNLCYSMMLSKRTDLAFSQIRKYQNDFPKGLMTTILKMGATNRIMWKIVSGWLIYREYHR